MKKILLATTILGMTAGFASAEIAFTGSAAAGFAMDGGDTVLAAGPYATTNINPYASFKLSIAATGESDSGLTFGASTSVSSGISYAFADDDGWAQEDGMVGKPTIFIAGDFGKITVKGDGFKEYKDDNNETYDIEYTGTFGGLSVGVRTDVHSSATKATGDDTTGMSSVKLGYEVSGVTLSAAYDENGDIWGISAAKAFGPLTATIATDSSEVSSLKVAYAADAMTASLKVASDDSWEVAAGYTAAGLTIGAATDDADAWKVTAGYDLGGGLSLEAGTNFNDDAFLGAKMAF